MRSMLKYHTRAHMCVCVCVCVYVKTHAYTLEHEPLCVGQMAIVFITYNIL